MDEPEEKLERLQIDLKGLPPGTVHELRLAAFDEDLSLSEFIRQCLLWLAENWGVEDE